MRDRGASYDADAARLYGLHTSLASALPWLTAGDDERPLDALKTLDFLLQIGDPLLALGQETRRIRAAHDAMGARVFPVDRRVGDRAI